MSMSLAQGENGFPFLQRVCINTLVESRSVDEIEVNFDDVPHHEAHHFLSQVASLIVYRKE